MKRTVQVFITTLLLFFASVAFNFSQSVLFDNGPFYNSVGTGAGGANESVLYTTTFGMSTIGFGHQQVMANRIADDFTFTDCKWQIDSIVFFAYQTGSTTTSTFTGVTFRIWDSIPDAPGSNIVYGDTNTNAMIRSVWSGAYRITETTVGNTTRPIMRNTCIVNSLILNAGTYWIDWASSGSLASGPWAPARTPVGISITGNGRQRIGTAWNNAVDGGTGTPAQGFPFIIYGSVYNANADAGIDDYICNGGNTLLGGTPAGTGTGAITYAWSPAAGISNTSLPNPTLSNITSTAPYILTVTDSIGCMDTDTVTINSLPVPTAVITPAGPTSFCPGGSVTLDATIMAGYSYLWSTSETTTSINTNLAGDCILDVTDSSGCMNSDTITITVYPLPVANINPGGNVSICPGTSATLTADPGVSYNYLWSTTETTQSINVSAAGTIILSVSDSVGCINFDTITVSISPAPDVTVTQAGASLTSNQAGASYQWIDCNNGNALISGATSQNYIATANGSYAVIVDLGGCADTSSCNTVFGFGIEDETNISAKVFPNPSSDLFYIEMNTAMMNDYQISIYNSLGQLIQTKLVTPQNTLITINCSEWQTGIYLITGVDSVTHKEFKQRIVVQ